MMAKLDLPIPMIAMGSFCGTTCPRLLAWPSRASSCLLGLMVSKKCEGRLGSSSELIDDCLSGRRRTGAVFNAETSSKVNPDMTKMEIDVGIVECGEGNPHSVRRDFLLVSLRKKSIRSTLHKGYMVCLEESGGYASRTLPSNHDNIAVTCL